MLIDGHDPLSWLHCVLGCVYHDYNQEAQKLLILMNVVNDYEWFNQCNPTIHWVCNVCPQYHINVKESAAVALAKGGVYQAAKVSNHFVKKCERKQANMTKQMFTFRYELYLQCISIVFNGLTTL